MKRIPHSLFLFFPPALLAWLIFPACTSVDEASQLADHYRKKAAQYMVKGDSIPYYFDISEKGVSIFANPEAKKAGKAEFFVAWEERLPFRQLVASRPWEEVLEIMQRKGVKRFSKNFIKKLPEIPQPFRISGDSSLPLQGLRVALDPGHIGGDMEFALMERKAVMIKADPDRGIPEEIAFNEGNLALATAYLLRDSLQKLGAEVLLTREGKGISVFGITFDQWMEQHKDSVLREFIPYKGYNAQDSAWWYKKAEYKHFYHHPFLWASFRERARKINAFHPHLTLVIHYNVEESNEPDKDGYREALEDNYSMAFVPGSWMDGELDDPQKRLEFIAKLLSPDIEQSLDFSKEVVSQYEDLLKVPALKGSETLKYIHQYSLPTPEKGVFARNLALNRQIKGTLCFGEALLQDNVKECVLLNRRDFQIHDVEAPNRVITVAWAYLNAIRNYLAKSGPG